MNPLPESRLAELRAETSIDADRPPVHPDLRADWHLKQELNRLPAPDLPPALRARVMAQTTDKARRRLSPQWLGLAAALVAALALMFLQMPNRNGAEPGQPHAAISPADLEQLQVALATLDDSARLTGRMASRELSAPLITPAKQFELPSVAPGLLRWTQSARGNESDS